VGDVADSRCCTDPDATVLELGDRLTVRDRPKIHDDIRPSDFLGDRHEEIGSTAERKSARLGECVRRVLEGRGAQVPEGMSHRNKKGGTVRSRHPGIEKDL
jgi:hypothetical protein